MQIKRLRIAGFKSFVDPSELRIEPGLTGVVGPNGCGKSNLLEALRWTMGEGSAKSLRGAGMEDVIFAGTATRPARDFAEVSLLAEVDGDEREVVRRIERGAGSAYRIDGRDVRARDVALLFADAATGAHSPALVSQGRIGAVIAARPIERRAMLEEAAGIAGLHVRRRDAEGKLRATEANLQRLDEVIADQATRVAALRRQARAAERYRLISAQIRIAEARMIFARWRDAAAAADAAKAEASAAETLVATCGEAQRAAAAHQRQAVEALAAARAAAQEARDRASEAGHRLAALRLELATAERRVDEIAAARARLVDDRAREGTLASDAAAALAQLAEEGAALETRLRAANAERPERETALAEAERTTRDVEVALAQALALQASEAADRRVAAAAVATARTRADRARREVAQVAGVAALGDAATLERARSEAAAAIAAATQDTDAARQALGTADHDERAAITARDRDQVTRANACAELAAMDGEIAALTRANPPAARDRLLDRLTVAPGYERALAAALGDDLDAGLEPGAERRWVGANVADDDPPAPGDAVPLATHVAAPTALARRLVQVFVVDHDDGRALAVGQRVVTRAGELRRWDGLVVRGGASAASERLERRNRLAALQAARPAAAEAAATTDAALTACETRIAAARSAAQVARGALAHAEAAAREARQREDRAAAAIERLAAQRADLRARTDRAAAELGDAEDEAARAQEGVAALPDGCATAARVTALGRDAEERRRAVGQARGALAALEAGAATARERLAAATAETRGWRARLGEGAKRIAAMVARDDELTREAEAAVPLPAALAETIAALAERHDTDRIAAEALAVAERDAEATLRDTEAQARAADEALATARETRAGAAARAENQELRRIEMGRLSGERFQCPAPVLPDRAGFDAATVAAPSDEAAAHETLTRDRERIGAVNLVAEQELAELEGMSAGSAAERDELAEAVARLRGSIGTLNREGRQRLLAAFEAVDGHFRRLFTTLFDGGQAHLALVDSDDPLEAGLEIMAQPPGKRLQSLTLLSGGEQALTAVALIFGLFLTNPAPICVLDEVDAPLDDANIERFCDLLDRMTRETATRYLIVTHNAVTMSRMHRLFGVTMVERGVSRLVSVDLRAAETLLAAE